MHRIVFVCTGNLCRSPMAEGILRDRWQKTGRNDMYVSSTGIHARENQPATEHAKIVCSEHGIDISRHLSHPLQGKELKAADYIFTMETVQKDYVLLFFPGVQDKISLLGEAWQEGKVRNPTIADPVGGSLKQYRQTFQVIAAHIDRLMFHLQDILGPSS